MFELLTTFFIELAMVALGVLGTLAVQMAVVRYRLRQHHTRITKLETRYGTQKTPQPHGT